MPKFIIQCAATADILETWEVEAENEDEALDRLSDGDARLICDEITGEEQDRRDYNVMPATSPPWFAFTVIGLVDHDRAVDCISCEVMAQTVADAWELALECWKNEADSPGGLHGESGYSLDSQALSDAIHVATHRGHNLSA